ncbi:hypothetical protein EBT31_10340 [bacterium]|nr:hypothetical protein [bacterium]
MDLLLPKKHISHFGKKRFALDVVSLRFEDRFRNAVILFFVRCLGDRAGYVFLEAVETHGIKKYLDLWAGVEDSEVREGLRSILTDELLHEDEAATGGKRTVLADVVRNAFLGFNDGSVEILGAVTGLVAALGRPDLVFLSALTGFCGGKSFHGSGSIPCCSRRA